MIILDENFSIVCDATSATLKFQEQRERPNKTTDVLETYIFKDQWFLLSVPQALGKYRDLKLVHSQDLKDVLEKLEEVNKTIKALFIKK